MGPVAQKFRSGVLSSVLDSDKNEEERLELMEGFKKGNFDDIKELSKKGLKLWTAPMKLTAPSSSPLMVNIEGKSLLGVKTDIHTLIKHKDVSLVTFVFTALGEPHVKSYMTPFLEAFPEGNVIQMNIEEEWTKSWALALFEPFIRFKVPEKQRAQYLIKRGSVLKERTKIKMDNRLLGWVHLVDREGRVRWTAHGPAKDEEIQALIANTKLLMA
ncbi:hypothetical protein BCR33DRAFT_718251 [Rhizoclosmatium globosum]|uniref:Thioredoxin domain-containing protein n=1 Tax=Rhizoclosmatium globosum TaxID=329046 RepID=A0A1Y2C693_9FUNG|nr:hypothetical protein BCR33DRAFT_718251 [Rhizoclosmatium globosum]|eukprot:ORY42560.1 hypothetical protein BCR33DRAFT_718251 [Rhizoclosmatium globosum]